MSGDAETFAARSMEQTDVRLSERRRISRDTWPASPCSRTERQSGNRTMHDHEIDHETGHEISVVIADCHQIFRDGLRGRLERHGEFNIVGEVADGASAVRACEKRKPDVVVLDLRMPHLNGADALPKILRASPRTRVLIASVTEDPIDVQVLLARGAAGYVLKQASGEEFVNAVRVVAGGGSYLPTTLLSDLIAAACRTRTTGNMFGLTPREIEVLRETALGKCNKEMARKFGLSVRTVETHRQNIRQKTAATCKKDLVRVAVQLELIEIGGRPGVAASDGTKAMALPL